MKTIFTQRIEGICSSVLADSGIEILTSPVREDFIKHRIVEGVSNELTYFRCNSSIYNFDILSIEVSNGWEIEIAVALTPLLYLPLKLRVIISRNGAVEVI